MANSGLLRLLIDALARHVVAGGRVHADDTPEPVPGSAHVRRKLFSLGAWGKSLMASEALRRVQVLYVIEHEVRGRPPDDRRRIQKGAAGAE